MAVPQNISDIHALGHFVGPFVYEGSVYIVASDTAGGGTNPGEIAVLKADDPQAGAFVIQDSGNQPTADGSIEYQFGRVARIGCASRNNIIHVVAFQSNIWEYHTFDMESDTWDLSEDIISGQIIGDGAALHFASVAVRWNGEVVVQYDADPDKIHGTEFHRNEWARRNTAGSWNAGNAIGAPTNEQTHWVAGVAILGGDGDRVHFAYNETTTAPVNQILSRTLDGSDSLSSELIIDSASKVSGQNTVFPRGVCYDDDGTVRVRFLYINTDDEFHVGEFDSVDSPSSPTTRAVTTDADASPPIPACICAFRKILFVAYHQLTDDIHLLSSDDDGAWTSEGDIDATGVLERASSCNVIDYGDGPKVGMLYFLDVTNVIRYNEFDIAPAAIDWDTEGVFPDQNYALGPFGT